MVIAIAILIILAVDQAATIWRHLASIVSVAILFTLVAGALGLALAKGFSWNREDTVTLMAAFPSRSLSVATLIAVNVLGRLEFLSFAVVFYVVQSALLIAAMIALRDPQKLRQ